MAPAFEDRLPNPCHHCPDRYTACSDHCTKPERLAWLAEKKKIDENRKNYQAPAWVKQESWMGGRR